MLDPTTTEPSAETPLAPLLKVPPGRSPRPMKNGVAASSALQQTNQITTAANGGTQANDRIIGSSRESYFPQ
jgi:hypothetical protein